MTTLRKVRFNLPEKTHPDFNDEMNQFLRDRVIHPNSVVSVCRISDAIYDIFYIHSDGQL